MALTAGQGSRLRPFTEKIAKPAIPFLGTPLLCHAARHLSCLELDKLVMNLHWCGETVREVSDYLPLDVPMEFSDESTQLLGSGGGVKKAEPFLKDSETILLFNGDEVLVPKSSEILKEMLSFHLKSKNLATLLVMDHAEVGKKFGGAWVDGQNNIQKFSKTSVSGLKGFHYVGYMLMQREAFQYFSSPAKDENLLYDCMTKAIANRERVQVYPCEAQWYETGDIRSFLRATQALDQQIQADPHSPEISDLLDFLETSRWEGSGIDLTTSLESFDPQARANVYFRLELGPTVRGNFTINTKPEFPLENLVWPAKSKKPTRKDELWKTTCVEMFFGAENSTSYVEFNFSPSTDWNSYHFESERAGMKPYDINSDVDSTLDPTTSAQVNFETELNMIPTEIGVTAILQWKDGRTEYYALQHSKDKPDFHNRKDWIWRLG